MSTRFLKVLHSNFKISLIKVVQLLNSVQRIFKFCALQLCISSLVLRGVLYIQLCIVRTTFNLVREKLCAHSLRYKI